MSYCADTNKYVVVSIRDRDVLPKDISNEDILYVLSIMDSYQSAVNLVVNEGVGTNDCMPTVVFNTLRKSYDYVSFDVVECPVSVFTRKVMLNHCIDVSDFYKKVHQYWCSLDTFN